MMSSALFFDPLLIHSLCDISEGEKALFGWTKFQKILGDTFLKFRILNSTYLRTKVSLKKIGVIYT